MDLGLNGTPCLVTGASRGIGLATAGFLCGEGAHVLLTGRDDDALNSAARRCAEQGGRAEYAAMDVTAPDAGERLVEECAGRFGDVVVLVNNAGTSSVRGLHELTDDEWNAQWELHVMAPMRLMRAAVPAMAARGEGRVVNVSSSSGKRPSQTNPAYSVTKAAVLSLSRVFADAYAGDGINVNAVTPGPVASSLWTGQGGLADQMAEAQGSTRDEILKAAQAKTPRGRFGSEEEVAAVIGFLCSPAAANVTGAAWSVDGGAVPVIL